MRNRPDLTEFELHAFIDGELAADEQCMVLEATAACSEIRERLEQLQCLKKLVKTCYQAADCPEAEVTERAPRTAALLP